MWDIAVSFFSYKLFGWLFHSSISMISVNMPWKWCHSYTLLWLCDRHDGGLCNQLKLAIWYFTSTLAVMSHKINTSYVFVLRRISALHMFRVAPRPHYQLNEHKEWRCNITTKVLVKCRLVNSSWSSWYSNAHHELCACKVYMPLWWCEVTSVLYRI